MREILFRAKRIDDNEWIEGYLFSTKEHTYIAYPNQFDDDLFLSAKEIFIEVDPETVCQYTGLTDKNGRKIFEGDILSGERYHDWGQGGEYIPDKCVIKWNEKRAAFDPIYWWEGYNHDLKYYEVIGNIYDNPELIGDQP